MVKKAKADDDEYKATGDEKNYYSIAHTIKETVTEQAKIMINGRLKEYQVKVGGQYQFLHLSLPFINTSMENGEH